MTSNELRAVSKVLNVLNDSFESIVVGYPFIVTDIDGIKLGEIDFSVDCDGYVFNLTEQKY